MEADRRGVWKDGPRLLRQDPVEPDKEVVKACADALGLEPTTEKVVDINDKDPSKGVEAAKAMLKKENLPTTDENIFITATCKEKGPLSHRKELR